MKALHELGVVEAAAAIRAGEITAEQLCAALLSRTEAHAGLNAFCALDANQVLEAAREADCARGSGKRLPPLHGVPIALKDNINTKALPTAAGTPALRRHRPAQNAPVAQALFDAGALLFGKVGMHELAFGITSNNTATGAIHNPYDPSRIPGGSSGGSGAAVGARLAPASIGSDTGGSVRVPSSFCGVWGFRPTVHRWPQAGIVPISATRDTAGPLARNVADLVALDGAVTGQPMDVPVRPLTTVRIGIPRGHFWDDIDDETGRLCDTALAMLREAGAILIEADVPDVKALDESCGFSVALYEIARDLDRYLQGEGLALRFADVVAETASPDVKGILGGVLDPATAISEQVYREARDQQRARLQQAYRSYFAAHNVDVIAFPTTPLPAPPIGQDDTIMLNGRAVPTFPTIVRNTGPGSNAGIPGISTPAGLTRTGLPVGLALDAPADRDRDLLAIALAVEAVLPPLPVPR
ncbi:indoleacetamide hydrolase [Bradyrhizobium prioriisuperbiae]|uniref:indoleacetamide hydrolase n=1 Tax=Bradyrhizobium prioriisuperbiae TaxID=2854389 RepID=UPI0028F014EB|nr:indoleacetamide hydrolase [Bradyrhizobium prioritasuperba]